MSKASASSFKARALRSAASEVERRILESRTASAGLVTGQKQEYEIGIVIRD